MVRRMMRLRQVGTRQVLLHLWEIVLHCGGEIKRSGSRIERNVCERKARISNPKPETNSNTQEKAQTVNSDFFFLRASDLLRISLLCVSVPLWFFFLSALLRAYFPNAIARNSTRSRVSRFRT